MKLARGILKVLALVGGAFITVVSLMAVAGSFVDNGWARAGIAIVVALGVPLFLVERILARLPADQMRGVPTDVLSLIYVAFALVFVGVAHGSSRPLLQDEGQRLERAGMPRIAKAAYLLAGGSPGAPAAAAPATAPEAPKPAEPEGKPKEPEGEPKEVAAKQPELRPGDGKERTPAQIFTEFAPAVVTISIKGPLGEGGGTGFVLDDAGTVGTNHHVIDGATEIKVKLMDGTVAEEVEVLAENEAQDLALLKIKTPGKLVTVVLGDSEKVTVGERAVSIGNPLGLEHTLTDGLISARRMLQGKRMIQMSTPVSPGNSGGPLFNLRGEVIGVSTGVYHGHSMLAQNLNLAMPINDLRAMIRSDYPGRRKPGQSTAKGGRW
ncbi:MAG TPA: trypsin-like peptidase domain-containing protein [Kofleriaceae bacterium]|nr:trypsin-like peptidase domain-containing protein [Kofleriaceae bacterium]